MSRSISFDNFIMTYRHLLHTLLNLYIIRDSAINPPYRCGVLYWRDDCSSHTNWITKYLPQRSSLGNAIVLFKVFKIFWPSQRNVIDADKSTTWSLIGSRKHPNIPNSWGQELHFQRADGENCSSAWAQTCSWLEKSCVVTLNSFCRSAQLAVVNQNIFQLSSPVELGFMKYLIFGLICCHIFDRFGRLMSSLVNALCI